jgi:hypothetical protein
MILKSYPMNRVELNLNELFGVLKIESEFAIV